MPIFESRTPVISLRPCTGWSIYLRTIHLYWIIVGMPYHRLNNLAELINGEFTAKIGKESPPMNEWIENVTVLFHPRLMANASMKKKSGKNV